MLEGFGRNLPKIGCRLRWDIATRHYNRTWSRRIVYNSKWTWIGGWWCLEISWCLLFSKYKLIRSSLRFVFGNLWVRLVFLFLSRIFLVCLTRLRKKQRALTNIGWVSTTSKQGWSSNLVSKIIFDTKWSASRFCGIRLWWLSKTKLYLSCTCIGSSLKRQRRCSLRCRSSKKWISLRSWIVSK